MSNINTVKRLYNSYTKKYLKNILIAFIFSIILAGSTSSVAYLLDPAIEKLFIEQNQSLTQKALQSIQKVGVLEDWQLSIKLTDGEKKMTGLKKIAVEKLKNLSKEKLYQLNQTGGLDICFASIFSLNNIENLKDLLIGKTQIEEKDIKTKSIRDITIEKQNKQKKEEMDDLVKNLLSDNET